MSIVNEVKPGVLEEKSRGGLVIVVTRRDEEELDWYLASQVGVGA